jgi:hypothetical protein
MINTTQITFLHLSTTGTKDNPKGCLYSYQKGKRDYMNTKEYRLLAQKGHEILGQESFVPSTVDRVI